MLILLLVKEITNTKLSVHFTVKVRCHLSRYLFLFVGHSTPSMTV